MRRVPRILAFVLLCSALLSAKSAQESEKAAKESAKAAFKHGVQAEARQDYEAAYEYYKHAYDKQPSDLKYRLPYERTRFLAAASKVHRALKLREQGELQDALTLLEEAAAMDPSNDLAAQEIRRTQEMIQKQAGGQVAAPPRREEEDVLRKRLEEARPPVRLNDIASQQLSALEFATEDTKVIYETIGKLAGINVLFDPDYTSRRLPIKLQKVSLQEALDIVALESRTFWRPVTPNTIFVAADTPTKRRELEQNVIKTFYLGNVATATDLQDIVNAIRTVLEVSRIQQIPSQNAIVIKGTPDQLAMAQKMVDDIDKGKPEVVVDVIVAQVRRDKLRDIGITPPQTASVQFSNGATTTATTGSGTNGTNTTPSSNFPNFNDLQHLNSTNYQLIVGPVVAKLLFSDDSTKILQSPRIRATDNEKAVIKIGDKLPIATGSFGTPVGVGTVGAGLGVNTQFTYTEVGVKLEITPHIHPDGRITLKTALEVSNKTGDVTIGGIDQPVISQRTADQTMTLNDGEVNFMGGILEESEALTKAGTPFLGQIPILRYLFSEERKEKITNEIVFLLIPHVVRRQELTELNIRPLDVGTGTSIDLHVAAKPLPQAAIPVQPAAPGPSQPSAPAPVSLTQPANPSGAPVQNSNPAVTPPQVQPAAPQGSPAAPQGAASQPAPGAPGGQASLRLDSPNPNPAQGSTFALNVVLARGQDVAAVSAQIVYDPKVVQFVSATQGDFLTKDGQPATPVNRDDPGAGRVTITVQRAPGSAGVSGEGTVFNLMFLAKAKGSAAFSIVPAIRNPKNEQITVTGSQAVVTVN
jgi:general secretion pathway protein D